MRLTNSFLYLISWFALLLFGAVGSSHASTNVSGTISEDTTWTLDGSPYVVTSSSVTVAEGVTLTVDPGVVVKFYSYKSLDVYGALDARGTIVDPIIKTIV